MRGFLQSAALSNLMLTLSAWAQCSGSPGGQAGPVAVERVLLNPGP